MAESKKVNFKEKAKEIWANNKYEIMDTATGVLLMVGAFSFGRYTGLVDANTTWLTELTKAALSESSKG